MMLNLAGPAPSAGGRAGGMSKGFRWCQHEAPDRAGAQRDHISYGEMDMIDWKSMEPQPFERAVQALLKRTYPGLRSLDGAGGDGGRDAQLVTADGLQVFEMKSFSRSLTKQQRAQIVSSLKRALVHAPAMTKWTLVIAKNMTPRRSNGRTDESWFEDELPLVAPAVELEWLGQDWLDLQASQDMSFQNYVEGPNAQVLARAKEFKQESEVMAAGAVDLFQRNATLRQRADEISMHWRLSWAVTGDEQMFILEEKYPGAAVVDPIVLKPEFSFDVVDDDGTAASVRSQLVRTLAFGGKVEVPGRYVKAFGVEASPEARLLLNAYGPTERLRIESLTKTFDPPMLGSVAYVETDGTEVASVDLYFQEQTGGADGVTLRGGDGAGLLALEVLLPYPPEDHVSGAVLPGTGLSFETRDIAGHGLESVSDIVRLLVVATPGRCLQLQFGDGHTLLGEPLRETQFPGLGELADVVAALRRLQRHCGKRLRFPRGMTNEQADMIMVASRLLDGEQVPIGGTEWAAGIVGGEVEAFLRTFSVERFQILYSRQEAVLIAGDLQIPYGPLCQWGPDLSLANRAELEKHDGRRPATARFATGEHPVSWLSYDKALELTAGR